MTRPGAGAAVHLATVGPAGHFPVAPGTAGSVVGVILVVIIHRLLPGSGGLCGVAIVAAVVYGVGVWAAGRAEKFYGVRDPGAVVIDEVGGQMLVFLSHAPSGWLALLAGLVLFRIFDVLKPFPARRAERLPGGWGIMTDDIVAGAYGAAALFLLGYAIR